MVKKLIQSYLLNVLIFSSLILMDLYGFSFGLKSYQSIFRGELVELLAYNWKVLSTYLVGYLCIFFLFCWQPTLICFQMKNFRSQAIVSMLFLVNIFLFSAVQFPQLFYPYFRIDYLISSAPDNVVFVAYIAVVLLLFTYAIKNLSRRRSQLFSAFIFVAHFGFQIASLYSVKFPYKAIQKVSDQEALIVISMDSIRSDSFDEIKKFSKGTFKDYLSKSRNSANIIADTTQTRESFYSIFSGKNAFELKNRYPFSPVFSESNQSQLGFLKDLQNRSYRTILFRDEQETVHINPGPAIDNVITTAPMESLSTLLNKVSHSFVIFQLIPHNISEVFAPTFFNASTQAQGYNANHIANLVIKNLAHEIQFSKAQGKKTFAFIHSCLSHAPVKLPYPYNQHLSAPRDNFDAFSYSDFKNHPLVSDWSTAQRRHEFDHQYYLKMIQYMTEQYLNPLFEQLNEVGVYNPDNIVLMSDHGENFWDNRNFLPIRHNFPFHGDTDLFGARADRPLFVSNHNFESHKTLNLSQALNLLINEKSPSEKTYTESSFSLGNETSDFLHLINYSVFVKEYKKQQSSNNFYIPETFDLLTSLYVQKSFYLNDLKISTYRTPTGRKMFICAYSTDLECSKNRWFDQSDQRAIWTQYYNKLIEADVVANKESSIKLNKENEIDQMYEIESSLRTENFWLVLYAGIVKLTVFNKSDILDSFYQKHKSDPLLSGAYTEVEKRYLRRPEFTESVGSEMFSYLDNFENMNQLIMSNRIEIFLRTKISTSAIESISSQLSRFSEAEKAKLYDQLSLELDQIFRYSIEYQLPYQSQSYWSLLFKFAKELNQNSRAINKYKESQLKTNLTLNFKKNLEIYISKISN